jgi:hypothetical protein
MFRWLFRRKTSPSPTTQRRPSLETLESRIAPYAAMGAWPSPQLITISFVPDGTPLSSSPGGPITSNLFSVFDAKFGSASVWQNLFLKAAQTWAQQTNINFAVVPDDGESAGGGPDQQGDPGFGDIRIGGYNFGSSQLAGTYLPAPDNNYSIAGDITFNTGQVFNIGSTFDLLTVALHEFGHALGLGESSVSSSVMYATYMGVRTTLTGDDVSGIRSIYSGNTPRSYDAYYGASPPNNSIANAANVTSLIDPVALTATVPGLDITTTSEVEYFTFDAPANTTGTLQVAVQSQGLSLLSPKETVYAANGTTVLGSASGLNKYGTTLDVTVNNVTPGEQFYVKVQGADTTAFSTGDYGLALSFTGSAPPTIPSPNTTLADGSPLQGSGGEAELAGAAVPAAGAPPAPRGASAVDAPSGPANPPTPQSVLAAAAVGAALTQAQPLTPQSTLGGPGLPPGGAAALPAYSAFPGRAPAEPSGAFPTVPSGPSPEDPTAAAWGAVFPAAEARPGQTAARPASPETTSPGKDGADPATGGSAAPAAVGPIQASDAFFSEGANPDPLAVQDLAALAVVVTGWPTLRDPSRKKPHNPLAPKDAEDGP